MTTRKYLGKEGQFQTVIKSELIEVSIRCKRDPPCIVCIYSEKLDTKQSG